MSSSSTDESCPSSSQVHRVATKGFDSDSRTYEAARPSYPPAAVECLLSRLNLLPPGKQVLDLAAGSGKLTRLLVQQHPELRVTAVEPSPSMRAVFREVLPSTPILDGTATAIPAASESQDAVVVAQAFHWFATPEALREICRVLKPGGSLGLIWNLEDRDAAAWVGTLRDCYEKYEQGTPQYRLGLWRRVWRTSTAEKLFSALDEAHWEHEALCSEDTVWGRVVSKSYIACLPDQEKDALREAVIRTLNGAADVQRDLTSGLIRYPFRTDVYWCRKL